MFGIFPLTLEYSEIHELTLKVKVRKIWTFISPLIVYAMDGNPVVDMLPLFIGKEFVINPPFNP